MLFIGNCALKDRHLNAVNVPVSHLGQLSSYAQWCAPPKHSRRFGATFAVLVVHALAGWFFLHQSHMELPLASPSVKLLMAPAQKAVQQNLIAPPLTEMVLPQVVISVPPEVSIKRDSTSATVVTDVERGSEPTSLMAGTQLSTEAVVRTVLRNDEIDYARRPVVRYPATSQRQKEQGTVLLSVLVSDRGLVTDVVVLQSAGYKPLDEAAMRALRTATFRPYIRNGVAVPVEVRVPVEFSLAKSGQG